MKTEMLNDSVIYEIVYALGIPTYDETDYSLWELIHFSRTAHARLLADFFRRSISSTSEKWDDLVSEDYGFGPVHLAISPAELERINKGMMHMSCSRVGRSDGERKWNDQLIGEIHRISIDFIDHILSGSMDPAIVIADRPHWEELQNILRSRNELRIHSTVHINSSGGDYARRLISQGRSLRTGLSEVTAMVPSPISSS